VAACHLELAAHWGLAGKPLPEDAFTAADYPEGDATSWPIFISMIHAVAGSALAEARVFLNRLIADHPRVLPSLLAALMERRMDREPLKKVTADLLGEFQTELAQLGMAATERLEEVRCVIHREHFNNARTISLIFQLCVSGGSGTRSAVERHVDSPLYGRMAVAAMRAGASSKD
jgi:hypothetical protein